MAFQLKNKISKLRANMLRWNRDVFGRVENEIYQKQKELMLFQNSILNADDARRESFLRGLRDSHE